jgi:hypothetical protein
LELALGQILSTVSPEQVSDFLDCKAVLESDLASYLQSEQRRIDVSSEVVRQQFQRNISNFYEEFSRKDQSVFLAWQKQVSQMIQYQFICFNYTNALARVVEPEKRREYFASHRASGQVYQDTVGQIVHLHGTLSGDLILGLDNKKQIANSGLQEAAELTNYIIKPVINEALGEGKTEAAKQIIDDSDYVCVYGMSLGDTDRMWWKYLIHWLAESPIRRLVLYVYEKATDNPSGPEKLRQQDKWKNRFLQAAGASTQYIEKLRPQIIIVLGSRIFEFDDIRRSHEEM